MGISFELSDLRIRVRSLEKEIEAFRNGEEYQKLEEKHRKEIHQMENERRKLTEELSKSRRCEEKNQRMWEACFASYEKESEKRIQKEQRKQESLRKDIERQNSRQKELKAENSLQKETIKEMKRQLEEKDEIIKKLQAQINRDFENSSIPSSCQGAGRKKIPNTREKSGKKPGAQPGHTHHPRQKVTPTKKIWIPATKEITNNPDNYPTGETITKQLIKLSVKTEVIEFSTTVFRNKLTGSRIHAPFPEGCVDDVNYDASIKAIAFMLNSFCNVSLQKTADFLSNISNGSIKPSTGMICNLIKEFALRSETERQNAIKELCEVPAINIDFTNANVLGKSGQVLIIGSPINKSVLFIGCEKKGHEGIKGTIVENYGGNITHDHDKTFYKYGSSHQECHQHNIRYLKNSIEIEPHLTWNKQMLDLIRKMIHHRNSLAENEDFDEDKILAFEREYDSILVIAEKEYENNPPSKYNRDGYNLFLRLRDYRFSQLHFLYNRNISPENSLCERLARVFKRKQKQMMVFRSQNGLNNLCNCLSAIYTILYKGNNLFKSIINIFNSHGITQATP